MGLILPPILHMYVLWDVFNLLLPPFHFKYNHEFPRSTLIVRLI